MDSKLNKLGWAELTQSEAVSLEFWALPESENRSLDPHNFMVLFHNIKASSVLIIGKQIEQEHMIISKLVRLQFGWDKIQK